MNEKRTAIGAALSRVIILFAVGWPLAVAGAPRDYSAPAPGMERPTGSFGEAPDPGGTATSTAAADWVYDTKTVNLPDGMALEMMFEYSVAVPEDATDDYRLSLRYCADQAGARPPRCSWSALPVEPGTSQVRWGVDPTQYEAGENVYRFTLTLDGPEASSSSTLEVVVNVN